MLALAPWKASAAASFAATARVLERLPPSAPPLDRSGAESAESHGVRPSKPGATPASTQVPGAECSGADRRLPSTPIAAGRRTDVSAKTHARSGTDTAGLK